MVSRLPAEHRTVLIPSIFSLVCLMSPQLARCQPPAERKQPPARQLLFNGKDLSHWRIVSKFDFEKHGAVRVEMGVLVLERGNPATGVSWKKEFPKTNYEITLQAQRIEGDDFFCGLTFPVQNSHCTLILGGWGGNVTGLSNVDNYPADENETTGYQTFKLNQWYQLRLRVTDDKIAAWIDHEQIVDLPSKNRKFAVWWEQEPVRPFGIAAWNTKSGLKNIQLRRIRPDAKEEQQPPKSAP